MLRPAGKAQLGDRIVNVISEGPFIGADAAIEVVELSGNRIVVRQI
jgi:membrane-bound serine protease (ClpP class)